MIDLSYVPSGDMVRDYADGDASYDSLLGLEQMEELQALLMLTGWVKISDDQPYDVLDHDDTDSTWSTVQDSLKGFYKVRWSLFPFIYGLVPYQQFVLPNIAYARWHVYVNQIMTHERPPLNNGFYSPKNMIDLSHVV